MNLLAVLLDSLEGETKQREILKVRGGCQRKPEDERISGGGCKHLHRQPAEKRALEVLIGRLGYVEKSQEMQDLLRI